MNGEEKSRLPAILGAIVLVGLFGLFIVGWKILLQYSILIGLIIAFIFGWLKSESAGWRRISSVFHLLLFLMAMALGEAWYHDNQSLLWFGGMEAKLAEYNTWEPIAFMIGVGLLITRLLRVPFNFIGNWYSRNQRLPGTVGPYVTVVFFLAVSLYIAAECGAYIKKSKGAALGSQAISSVTQFAATTLTLSADVMNEQAEKAGDMLDDVTEEARERFKR